MGYRVPKIWPYHPRILPGELLSSWIVRLAHGNRIKVQAFTQMLFGRVRELWVRDIDRMSPKWLTRKLAYKTGRTITEVCNASLRSYQGVLYRSYRESSILPWILPLKVYHRTRKGYGLLFCPLCLAEDDEPYYRKCWRLAFYTFCPKHHVMMHECCPSCGAPVIFHRNELGLYEVSYFEPLSICYQCRFDLRRSQAVAPDIYDESSYQTLLGMMQRVEEPDKADCQRFDLGFFNVAHQMCKIILGTSKHIRMYEYLRGKVCSSANMIVRKRMSFEDRLLVERHEVVQLAAWLMAKPEERIIEAWRNGAVRYNVLGKDFKRQPEWYKLIVSTCSDWRSKSREFSQQL